MGAEILKFDQYRTQEEIERAEMARQAERIQKLTEPQSPTEVLGTMVVGIVVGGSLTGGVMPKTEAITYELVAGTTQVGDSLRDRKAA